MRMTNGQALTGSIRRIGVTFSARVAQTTPTRERCRE